MLTPAYKLTFSQKTGDEGGVLGAATSVGGGGKVIDTTDEPKASTVVDLAVTLDMGVPADNFTLVLGQAGALKPVRDDETTIELGYADNGGLTQVMVGTVIMVESNLTTTRVVGHSAAATLLRTFVEQTYESKMAGAIVRDLAGKAGVDVATAEDGISFPAYVVDGRRSIYAHLRDLADLCGFDLYINADGAVVFEKFAGGRTVHRLEYGKQILELEVLHAPPRGDRRSMG